MSRPVCETHEREVRRILQIYEPQGAAAVASLLERQFTVLHNRGQVLLGLCGIVITTTGFSGRIIAGTNVVAQWLIISGVTSVLVAACVVVWGVMRLRWITQQIGDTTEQWLRAGLLHRDLKTRRYRTAIIFLIVGLTLYVAAIALMLLYPHAAVATPGR
jgi:hypothetical protein